MNRTPNDPATETNPTRRLGKSYRFADEHMDLFFMAALGWGPSGGLDVGQAYYIADHIVDGDPDSWVNAFCDYGDYLERQASEWLAKGWRRSAGEMRLKAFASYRSAWQFAGPGERFCELYAQHQRAFDLAIAELQLAGTRFEIPWKHSYLAGHYFANADTQAPLVLVIGGSDTCHEDLFLTVGRNLLERGYSVALADLPGQGDAQARELYWEAQAEQPIAAVIDHLVAHFGARAGHIALLGLSLGGYFACRAAGYESRLATVMASTPLPDAGEMFARSVKAVTHDYNAGPISAAGMRNHETTFWKAGATTPEELVQRTDLMRADPERVTLPFLSLLGGGESDLFTGQSRAWHSTIASTRKSLVELPAQTGADGHVQVNNRLRLAQECCGWLDDLFARNTPSL
ncbi:alpha/beta hydrolase [Pseudomonas sp. REP124]|uniref:alpha/beta hydrolase family protein n=1 Tax=Pseudomonas sp. REP124 TaxID=2875731 RepID=UPI001CCB9D31|nr:alpha/beta fold hydrolase [Pseudomonas sp. REP124]MBZ9780583.1 alpha/beta hydrolase [Pseudomonas sp. REP124]